MKKFVHAVLEGLCIHTRSIEGCWNSKGLGGSNAKLFKEKCEAELKCLEWLGGGECNQKPPLGMESSIFFSGTAHYLGL